MLAKLRLAMTSFIHKQIMNIKIFSEKIYDSFLQEQIGTRVFHDRVIERWRHEIDIDVASESYLKYPSKDYAKECASFKKKNLYVLFDQIEWNNEDGEVRMCIYILEGIS